MTPVQCGRWTIFCEKHKYKDELFLDKKFFVKRKTNIPIKQSEEEEEIDRKIQERICGRKKVKKDI